MPHCSFYGAEADFERILEFIFAELDCRVIESSSETNKPIVEFSSLSEVASHVRRVLFEKIGRYASLRMCPKPLSPLVTIRRENGRTTRHAGYAISQRIRKRVEEPFGWSKTVGLVAKTMPRGLNRVGGQFLFDLAAHNLVRLPKLLAA